MIEVIVKFITTTDSKRTSTKVTTSTTTSCGVSAEGSVEDSTPQDSSGRGYPVGANFHARESISTTISRGQSSDPVVNKSTQISNSPDGKSLTYPPSSVPPTHEFSRIPSRSESSPPPQTDYVGDDSGSTKPSKAERKKYKYVASLSQEGMKPRAGGRALQSDGMVTSGGLHGSSRSDVRSSRGKLSKPVCSTDQIRQPKLKPYNRKELIVTGEDQTVASRKDDIIDSSRLCKFSA